MLMQALVKGTSNDSEEAASGSGGAVISSGTASKQGRQDTPSAAQLTPPGAYLTMQHQCPCMLQLA